MSRQRIHDSQMNISLPSQLHERLRESAWQERKTISAFCREIIELGMKQRESDEQTTGTVAAAST